MGTETKQWTNLMKRIRVIEASNGFYIYDLKTNKCRGMGDGSDMFSTSDGESIPVGTDEFYGQLRKMVANEAGELREAYFGEGEDE